MTCSIPNRDSVLPSSIIKGWHISERVKHTSAEMSRGTDGEKTKAIKI